MLSPEDYNYSIKNRDCRTIRVSSRFTLKVDLNEV